MFWTYFLIIISFIVLLYAIYHLSMGISGWKLARKMKRGKQRPKGWVFLTHEAYKCGRKSEYQKSIEFAEKAVQLNPRASEAWRLIGNGCEFLGDEAEENGDHEQASQYYKKATEAWNKAKEINPHMIIPGYHE